MIAEPLLGLLQPLEFAGPADPIAGWQLHSPIDPLLSFRHGAGKIASAHAEFDRDVTLVSLAEDVRSAGVERDCRKLTERNVGVTVGILYAYLEIPHVVDVVALIRETAARRHANCRSASKTVVAVVPPSAA